MSILRRPYKQGKYYFITCVTFQRNPILVENIVDFQHALNHVRSAIDFDILAWSVLPDHFHWIIKPGSSDFSNVMMRFKRKFTALYLARRSLRSGRVWQKRFWDHLIRSQREFNRYTDYIHYNPVKHDYVRRPSEYPHSSINEPPFREIYPDDWGELDIEFEGDYGE
jgi:putative transposase